MIIIVLTKLNSEFDLGTFKYFLLRDEFSKKGNIIILTNLLMLQHYIIPIITF